MSQALSGRHTFRNRARREERLGKWTLQATGSDRMRRLTSAAQISLGGITAHHAMRGEDCTDLADRALHYACPAGWIAMKQGQHRASSFSYRALSWVSGASPSLPMAHPVTPSMQPSTHQPSSTLRLGTPLSAAFIPLVPDAWRGGCGVFNHRSATDTSLRASAMS